MDALAVSNGWLDDGEPKPGLRATMGTCGHGVQVLIGNSQAFTASYTRLKSCLFDIKVACVSTN